MNKWSVEQLDKADLNWFFEPLIELESGTTKIFQKSKMSNNNQMHAQLLNDLVVRQQVNYGTPGQLLSVPLFTLKRKTGIYFLI